MLLLSLMASNKSRRPCPRRNLSQMEYPRESMPPRLRSQSFKFFSWQSMCHHLNILAWEMCSRPAVWSYGLSLLCVKSMKMISAVVPMEMSWCLLTVHNWCRKVNSWSTLKRIWRKMSIWRSESWKVFWFQEYASMTSLVLFMYWSLIDHLSL